MAVTPKRASRAIPTASPPLRHPPHPGLTTNKGMLRQHEKREKHQFSIAPWLPPPPCGAPPPPARPLSPVPTCSGLMQCCTFWLESVERSPTHTPKVARTSGPIPHLVSPMPARARVSGSVRLSASVLPLPLPPVEGSSRPNSHMVST